MFIKINDQVMKFDLDQIESMKKGREYQYSMGRTWYDYNILIDQKKLIFKTEKERDDWFNYFCKLLNVVTKDDDDNEQFEKFEE